MKQLKISYLKSLMFGLNLYLFSASYSESNLSFASTLTETNELKSEYLEKNKNEETAKEASSQVYVLKIGALLSSAVCLYGIFFFFQNQEQKQNKEIII